ncbi:eukaryotic translation initiation factor 2 subunit alpha [Fusarium proliferatum]|nr:eukaryotic translation initiation factor 2 subunit alpha [Fusarium proliferatum]
MFLPTIESLQKDLAQRAHFIICEHIVKRLTGVIKDHKDWTAQVSKAGPEKPKHWIDIALKAGDYDAPTVSYLGQLLIKESPLGDEYRKYHIPSIAYGAWMLISRQVTSIFPNDESLEDIVKCEERYNKSKMVHSIVVHPAKTTQIPVEELYQAIAWPLNKRCGHAINAFKLSITSVA